MLTLLFLVYQYTGRKHEIGVDQLLRSPFCGLQFVHELLLLVIVNSTN